MATLGVGLQGADAVTAAVTAVIAALEDPATADKAADLVASAARPYVPVDKGTLAASASVAGGRLIYAVPYSAIVSARHPWLGDGISAAIPAFLELYDQAVIDAWTT